MISGLHTSKYRSKGWVGARVGGSLDHVFKDNVTFIVNQQPGQRRAASPDCSIFDRIAVHVVNLVVSSN